LPLISVIIPVANLTPQLIEIRRRLTKVSAGIEVIFVISKGLEGKIFEKHPFEKIVVSEVNGRGFACSQGMQLAKGEIIVFLHADTLLPKYWDELILNALANKKIVGGAFSLAFDTDHKYLKLLIFISDLFFKITSELWGDRAIFVCAEVLKNHSQLLDVPMMEDVKLSGFMKKKGKVVMLEEKVITSSNTFIKYGLLRHTFRIIKCRLWYALGGSLEKIYDYYYSKGQNSSIIASGKAEKRILVD
jgi:glycosyltransferase involved in cell wall biosynthesis